MGGVWSENVLVEVLDSNRDPKHRDLMIPPCNIATHTKISFVSQAACGALSLSRVICSEILVS